MTSSNRRVLYVLAFANLFLNLAFNVWRAVFNNFAVDEIGVSSGQIGLIQSIREIPGLMGFVIGWLVLWFSEMRIAGVSVIVLGAGMLLMGFSQDLLSLVGTTFLMSVGFHFFWATNSSVVLQVVSKARAPDILSRLSSIGTAGAVVGTAAVALIVGQLGLRGIMIGVGGLTVGAGVLLFPWFNQPQEGDGIRRRVVLRRSYGLYYVLQFLMGSRRHIFTTFAIFLLVKVHRVSADDVALLFLVNSVVSTLTLPLVGQLVARLGERTALTLNFIALTGIFVGYAYIDNLTLLYGLFVVDNIFFGFSLALNSYFQKIAVSPGDITSNVSVGQSINHVSAVSIPLIGGLVWEAVGPQATFLFGAGIVVVSLLLTQWMEPKPTVGEAAPV